MASRRQAMFVASKLSDAERNIFGGSRDLIGTTGESGGKKGRFVNAADLSSADLIGASGETEAAIKRGMELGGFANRAFTLEERFGPVESRGPFRPGAADPVPFFVPTGPAKPIKPEAEISTVAPGDPGNRAAADARQAKSAEARAGFSDPVAAGRREALLARKAKKTGGLAPLGRGFTARNLLSTAG